MLKSDLREATRKKAERKETKKSDSNGITQNKSNSKRMVSNASVYEIARLGQNLKTSWRNFFHKRVTPQNQTASNYG